MSSWRAACGECQDVSETPVQIRTPLVGLARVFESLRNQGRVMMTIASCMLCVLMVAKLTTAQSLDLSLGSIEDISGLGFITVGGADYDDDTGHLWVSEGGAVNIVAEIDPVTAQILSTFNASAVPGLGLGPDALAIDSATGNLFLFSSFQEHKAGEVTQTGLLVNVLDPQHVSAAAIAPSGELYVVDDTLSGGDGAIHRMNKTTGALETTVPINGYTGRISSIDFDPASGNLFAYAMSDDTLLEIHVPTGDVLSVTDVRGFLLAAELPSVPFPVVGNFAFNEDGTQVYLSRGGDLVIGAPIGGEVLLILNREVPACFALATFEYLGDGIPGIFGVTPQLLGQMTADACLVQLRLVSLTPASTILVVGLSQVAAPFKGGVLFPAPDLLLANVFGPFGLLTVDVPDGVPAGSTFYLQVWSVDQAGPNGYSATNGLSMTVY